MGLHKLTAGDGYTYLTRQVAAHDATEKGHTSLGDYYDERGESPGRWLGSGLPGLNLQAGQSVTAEQMKALFGEGRHPNAVALESAAASAGADLQRAAAAGALGRRFSVYDTASRFNTQVARAFTAFNRDHGLAWNTAIPVDVRAAIRTAVARRMFAEHHDRPPQNARELSGFVARASRQATSAVAGYDLTFSPVKSVSTLWALAPPPVADQVREAHDAAVADTLRWIEREAAFTRLGQGGVRQVATRGLVAAAFTHRDTRAGDPDLHTHLAVSNKVQDDTTGRWLALDGRPIHQATVAASERYNTRLEAELTARLGLRFAETAARGSNRPIREIVGINRLMNRWWSRRRRDIEVRRAELAAEFQTRHARPPTAVEAIALAQQASLETRAAKHAATSEAEQRTAWRREANDVLGGALEVDDMLDRALRRRTRATQPEQSWFVGAAEATVTATEAARATWQIWHLRAEAERQARTAGIGLSDLDDAVDQIVDRALSLSIPLGVRDPVPEPADLRRSDGTSVYEVHGSARFTSARILSAEQQILKLARSYGGRTLTEVRVGIAVSESAANGVELNDAQTAMVRNLATSGAYLQLALAPAGTGKTTAMHVLSRAWADSGGRVLGLAPSAQAAHELGHAINTAAGSHTDTLAKLTWTLNHAPRDQWPAWVQAIGPRSLVIIDEAGQAATIDLAAAVTFITNRGGVVRLIGDHQQLAAVEAGGVLRDIARTVGAATLSEVRRFNDPAEAAATIAIREGDPSALGYYADNDRIHVGDIGAVTDQAYAAWAADQAAGLNSILLAPTRDLVTSLNARARTDRLRALEASERGAEVRLTDGNHACAGDAIVTRRNARRLILSASNWVKNGDRWTITTVHPDHSITARHLELGRSIRLPGEYVAEHVELGYAATVHGAQGMTTDTAHTVVAGNEPRQLLYVAISRGRQANHIYLATRDDGDPHSLIHPDTLLPPTAIDILTRILERDGSHHSATTTKHALDSPATQLHGAVLRYRDALAYAAEQTLGNDTLTSLDAEVDAVWPGLRSEPAYPTLRSHLALLALEGGDPLELLLDAAQPHELDTAQDRAAVLDWRLTKTGERTSGPLPWLPALPDILAAAPEWGPYLKARAERVTALAAALHDDARAWSPTTAATWATGLTSSGNAQLLGDLAVWRAAFGVPDSSEHPTGPRQQATDAAAHQRDLNRRVRAATQTLHSADAGEALRDALPDCVQTDPRCARLLARLESLDSAGLDVGDLLNRVLGEPHPLPDELPADALWWRLVRHFGPATLRATGDSNATLRPPWVPTLIDCVGTDSAERMMADAAWPALVAAIHARPSEWTAEQLITAVADHHGPAVPAEELCSALVWRVATMTDPPPEPEDVQETEPSFPEVKALDPLNESIHTPFAPAPGTSVDRIVELNRWALEHYSCMYPRSWAPDYLRDRIGTDLTGETRFAVGYSPPGPASLSRHLSSRGATEVELIEAGLAKRIDNGLLIDAFRDRIIFPIYSGADLVGFIGRRNPTLDDSAYAGPKYLNTRTTAAFTKGQLLFGLTEGAGALATGATPVLVEGPLDAIAVSLAAPERAVGIAPLGTAFTDAQAVQLKPYFKEDPARIVIATDPDAAGWAAAQKAFWQLASLAADPKHLPLPPGVDPADVLRSDGTWALARLLERTQNFGTRLLACMVDDADLPDVAARLWLARDIARVIVALPPDQWIAHIDRATEQLDLPAGMLNLEVLDATETWSQDPAHEVRRQTGRLTAKMAADAERAQASSARGHLSVSRRPTSRRSTHTPPTASRRHGLPR